MRIPLKRYLCVTGGSFCRPASRFPLSEVIARLQPEIGYQPQDTGIARDLEAS
jgi:hypothetical protein